MTLSKEALKVADLIADGLSGRWSQDLGLNCGGLILLTTEQFQLIVGQAPAVPVAGIAEVRREVPRIALGRRARCIPVNGSKRHWSRVMIQDISIKGMGFLSQTHWPTGEPFVIQIDDLLGKPVFIRCTARRSERGGMGNASYVIGATFDTCVDAKNLPSETADHEGVPRGLAALLARASSAIRHIHPARLLKMFRRQDDYSSIDDLNWFRD